MSADQQAALGFAVLAIHVAVILFNIFGLIVLPLGAWRGWKFVRLFWWRALHLAILALVALQALAQRTCFLTVWQSDLTGEAATPLIARWINGLIYWPLPLWVFAALYVGVWLYAAAFWWLLPPRRG